jgi:nascent polypeptide-associated complex subunit alpha
MSKVTSELAEKLRRQHSKTEDSCFENQPEQTSADVRADLRRRSKLAGGEVCVVQKQRERIESAIHLKDEDSTHPPGTKAKSKAKATVESTKEQASPEVSEVVPGEPVAATPVESKVSADLVEDALSSRRDVDDNEKAEVDEDSDDDTEDDLPHLEGGTAGGPDGDHRQNRAEKKSRKAVAKLGMKPVPDIIRVAIKKAPNILFMIAKPDVFRAANSNVYVVFGEAKVEDMNAMAQASAAEKFTTPAQALETTAEITEVETKDDETGEVDETGVEPKDVELVMSQADVSRARAVKALKSNNNDIVEAIMALSSS